MNNLRNSVRLIGFLGKDPIVSSIPSGSTLARFTMATNETYLNFQGEKTTNTTWHNIVAWNKVAEICGQLLKKGAEVAVEGKLTVRTFEGNDGVKRYITEIQLNEVLLVGSKAAVKAEWVESAIEENELVFPELAEK